MKRLPPVERLADEADTEPVNTSLAFEGHLQQMHVAYDVLPKYGEEHGNRVEGSLDPEELEMITIDTVVSDVLWKLTQRDTHLCVREMPIELAREEVRRHIQDVLLTKKLQNIAYNHVILRYVSDAVQATFRKYGVGVQGRQSISKRMDRKMNDVEVVLGGRYFKPETED